MKVTQKVNIPDAGRTEEVTDIIERMPSNFAKYITYIVLGIVSLLLLFGFVVKYPDIVIGEMNVSAEQAPVQLVAEKVGRLKLHKIQSQDIVLEDEVIAWIDNPVHPDQVTLIDSLINDITLPALRAKLLYEQLPKNLNLGELTIPYSTFLSAVKQLADYQENRIYDKQNASLNKVLNEQESAMQTLKDKENLSLENLKLTDKFLERDSILLKKMIISQQEFEQSIAGRINAEDNLKTSLRNTGSIREQISNTESSIQQNNIIKSEKKLQLDLDLLSSFNNLIDKVNIWKKEYLIKSPIEGRVQFLKFWSNNQFVQTGEPLFSIVPNQNVLLGKVFLPISGAGKVKKDQKVIVKLADFPYLEYGYIRGIVKDISLVSSQIKTGDGNSMETYLVTVLFSDGLKTNYGTSLDFKFETKGTAEIITKDRRLIDRFFDNLKYIGHSK